MRPEKVVAGKPVGASSKTASYKDSLNLPKTEFPMRAGLATLEPHLLKEWSSDNLYGQLRAQSTSEERPTFTLHDGPPYANGHLHMGHALNKVLKDMVVRSRQMSGRDARFVPGWDCHGLPVEWKVEEAYRAKGLDKNDVPVLEFRQACRDYAAHWVDVQRAEFKRLGVNADWDAPYLTMEVQNEAAVAREFMTFLMNGTLYQNSKPVMWSPVEKTALAEAEVEYHDRKATAVWVGYEVVSACSLSGAFLLAWTTTPWTLPASQCVCYGKDMTYGLYEVSPHEEGSLAPGGEKVLVAKEAAQRNAEAMQVELVHLRDVDASELMMLDLRHPLAAVDTHFDRPMVAVPGDHVRGDAGTGFVHTAPDHGEDDYKVGRAYGLPMLHSLTDDGCLRPDMPVFGGLAVVEQDGTEGPANGRVMAELAGVGRLFAKERFKHSYPHSWRSKAPVLFRATPQWFVSVDKPVDDGRDFLGETMRDRATAALDHVQWLPATARARLAAMLRDRPDWVLSRQRAWGVPLTLFTRRDRDPHDPDFLLKDEAVNRRVLEAFEAEGADAWYRPGAKERFLAPDHDPELYDQCFDVLDVWFESGSSHAFVLKDRADGPSDGKADLYLEGTDQHRGWFQASLLHSVGTRGEAPFRAVLTHGFALDGKGRKMSKSVGNVVSPEDVVSKHGADVLRLWVALADTRGDFRAGEDALRGASETFRKLRNTMRYMLGALGEHPVGKPLDPAALPLLERWVMHRAAETSREVRAAFQAYDFARAVNAVHAFCSQDLSMVFFETRKDVLYCDPTDGPRRQAALDVMSVCLDACLSWLAPVLVFTAEDAWRHRHGKRGVHLQRLPDLSSWRSPTTERLMDDLLTLRDLANATLESERSAGGLTKSTHARLDLRLPGGLPEGTEETDLRDLCLVADLRLVDELVGGTTLDALPGAQAQVVPATGEECPRCRVVHAHLEPQSHLCRRCDSAMAAHLA